MGTLLPRISRRLWVGLVAVVGLLWLAYFASAFGMVAVSRARGICLDPMGISGAVEGRVVGLSTGYLFVVVQDDPNGGTAAWQWDAVAHGLSPRLMLVPWESFWGFSSHDYGGLRGYAMTGLWPCGLATGLLMLVRPKAKLREGACPNCGYDLRATPERCPECGAPVVGVAV